MRYNVGLTTPDKCRVNLSIIKPIQRGKQLTASSGSINISLGLVYLQLDLQHHTMTEVKGCTAVSNSTNV